MTQVHYWPCVNCGKEILNDCGQKTIPRKYCDSCKIIRQRMRNRVTTKPGPINAICKQCSIAFTTKRSHTMYCSRLCNVRALRKTTLHKNCFECGKEIDGFGRRKYCSNKCKLIGFHRMAIQRLEMLP